MAADDPRVLVLTEMRKQTALLERILDSLNGGNPANDAAPTVDLDSQYGDPVIKAKDPREWTGDLMKGRKLSECPANYLDLLAARYDWFNQSEEDPKKKKYNSLDAARARGWAARIRAGYKPPVSVDDPRGPRDAEPSW